MKIHLLASMQRRNRTSRKLLKFYKKNTVRSIVLHNFVFWARMYGNGLHDDLDNPPNVSAITGQPIKKEKEAKYEPLTEALAGAATAITKVLVAGSQASPTRHTTSDPKRAVGISPASKANLSGQYLQQLSTLQQLRENSVLSEDEFSEQKHLLLSNLRGLNAS